MQTMHIGDCILDKKYGTLAILDESLTMYKVAPIDTLHKAFWLPKEKISAVRTLERLKEVET